MKKISSSLAVFCAVAAFSVYADNAAPPSTTAAPTGTATTPSAAPPSTTVVPPTVLQPSTMTHSTKPAQTANTAPKKHKQSTYHGNSTSIYDSIRSGWNSFIDLLTGPVTQSK